MKILAGKTVEDVKKEAAREMAIMERMARLQPQSTPNAPNALRSNRPGAYNFAGSAPTEMDRATIDLTKRQHHVGPAHGLYAHASSLKPLQIDQRPQLPNQFHLRFNIPTYVDEFKQGFPTKGLSSVSTRWWGTALSNTIENLDDEKKNEDGDKELSPGHLEDASRKRTAEDHEGGDRKDDGTAREVKRLESSQYAHED
ncbi:hypothetical protein L7F22_014180 [Adiantum nelumboides]|nr:hypothetical protein [Adiantum nelumboides]